MDEIIERLEETFRDVTDVSDPVSMDKVLTILEESRKENEEYMELLVDKLEKEEVTWEQPPYQRNYCLTRKPPPEEFEQCTTGHFTKAEGDLVKKNWKEFVQKFKVPDKPVCLARWKNRDKVKDPHRCPEEHVRSFVTAYLARGLQRNLYQVNRYFLVQFGYPVKLRTYTPIEEKIMKICFSHSPKNAGPILSEVMGREPRGINKRYSEYLKGKPERLPKLKWSLELAAKFIHHLMEFSGCNFKQLKHNPFNRGVWRQVEQEMNSRYIYLREFWFSKLHVQLFAKCCIKLRSLRRIICNKSICPDLPSYRDFIKLQNSPYAVWSDIRWKEVVKEFPDGFTDMFLYIAAKKMFRALPDYRTAPLPALLARLRERRARTWPRRRLHSLKFHKNGELTYVQHEIPLKKLMRQMPIN